MFAIMLQMGFVLCLTPFMLLNQSVIQQRQLRQAEQVAQMLLVRHQALQQYCTAQADASGRCGFPVGRTSEIPLMTLRPYLPAAMQNAPLLKDRSGAVRSKFDGTLVVSYIDPTRLGSVKGAQLLGEVQSAWMRLSTNSICADVFHLPVGGVPASIRCADGAVLTMASALPEGAPVVADP